MLKLAVGVVKKLLVIKTTFAFAGRIPLTGSGNNTPPPVIVAFAFEIYNGSVQSPLHVSAKTGQVTFKELVFNGFGPT